MKILFVSKPYVIDPLGIAYLSSALKKEGHVVHLMKVTSNDPDTIFFNKIIAFKPDILAYSVYTGAHNFYVLLNIRIRRYLERNGRTPISIFGGPHCTFFPDIGKEPYIDAVFQGECDELFPKVLKEIENKNIRLRRRGNQAQVFKLDKNPQRLDRLPFPDRDLIYQFSENRDNPIKNIMTSRGCPFSCPYCYNSVYNKMFKGTPVRYRSVDQVIKEARNLKEKYPQTKFIFFEDDEFAMKVDRLSEFATKWQKIGLPFHAQLRIDLLTTNRLALLKKAGCVSITFAIESGNEKRRSESLSRKVSNAQILKGARLLRQSGILFRTENMLAQPGETFKEALETLDLNIACKPTIGWASLFQPYPRTPLGDSTIKQGLFDGNLDSIPSSFFDKTVLKMKARDKRRFENLQRLFGLVCGYPSLRKIVPILVELPQNKLYDNLFKWWKQKQYDKMYVSKIRSAACKTKQKATTPISQEGLLV